MTTSPSAPSMSPPNHLSPRSPRRSPSSPNLSPSRSLDLNRSLRPAPRTGPATNDHTDKENPMSKIQMKTPLVEMDGDEMTRILWQQIKEELLEPYIDLKTEYYDLGLPNREATSDQVTVEAAQATKKYGVAVKCATITPNAQRVEEYKLSQMWKSPNGTIRAILDGTVFRAPIMVNGISPVVKNWEKPITIARHAFGDVYKATEYRVPGPGKAELVFTDADGTQHRQTIQDFDGPGVLQGQFNYG